MNLERSKVRNCCLIQLKADLNADIIKETTNSLLLYKKDMNSHFITSEDENDTKKL